MYYIIYKTTNLINNKIYIGIHKQEDLSFDGYYGSGLLLNRSIQKHGLVNFTRETLFVFDNLTDARLKEKEIVDLEFCQRKDTYNVSIGGTGGNTLAGATDEQKELSYKKRHETNLQRGNYIYEGDKLLNAQNRMKKNRHQPNNKDKMYITDGVKTVTIPKDSEIPEGWTRGTTRVKKPKRMYITNGTDNKLVFDISSLPLGWRIGRSLPDNKKFKGHRAEILEKLSEKRQNKMYITDGKTNVLVNQSSVIPDGWTRGLCRHKKEKLMFITNGVITRKIKLNETIPEGWYKGRVFNKGS